MQPINERADAAYMQGLLCVEHRSRTMGMLQGPAYLVALALRYGLIGAAATHHVLLSTGNKEEERWAFELALRWPEMVEEHLRQFVRYRLPFHVDHRVPRISGDLAFQPVSTALRLYHNCYPLDRSLRAAAAQFAQDHQKMILKGVPWHKKRRVMAEFNEVAEQSVRYALNFFERREVDLEEVPEIVLLGE